MSLSGVFVILTGNAYIIYSAAFIRTFYLKEYDWNKKNWTRFFCFSVCTFISILMKFSAHMMYRCNMYHNGRSGFISFEDQCVHESLVYFLGPIWQWLSSDSLVSWCCHLYFGLISVRVALDEQLHILSNRLASMWNFVFPVCAFSVRETIHYLQFIQYWIGHS